MAHPRTRDVIAQKTCLYHLRDLILYILLVLCLFICIVPLHYVFHFDYCTGYVYTVSIYVYVRVCVPSFPSHPPSLLASDLFPPSTSSSLLAFTFCYPSCLSYLSCPSVCVCVLLTCFYDPRLPPPLPVSYSVLHFYSLSVLICVCLCICLSLGLVIFLFVWIYIVYVSFLTPLSVQF